MEPVEVKNIKVKREDECTICDSKEEKCEPHDCKDFKIKLRKIEEEIEHEEKPRKE